MMTAFEWAIPLIGAMVAGIGALWLRWSGKRIGRKAERDSNLAKLAKAERKAHERITDADTSGGATDAERVRELNSLADKLRRD